MDAPMTHPCQAVVARFVFANVQCCEPTIIQITLPNGEQYWACEEHTDV